MLPAVSLSGRLQNAAQNYCTYERNAREIYDCHPREVFNTKVVKDWIVPTATSLAIAILTAPLDAVVALLSTFTIIPLLFLDNKKEHLINTVMAVCVAVIAPFVFLINLFGAGQFLPLDYSQSYLNYRPSLKMLLIASEYRPRLVSSIKPLASILIKKNVLAKLSFKEQALAMLLNSKFSEDLSTMRIIAAETCWTSLSDIMGSKTLPEVEKINLMKEMIPHLDLKTEDDFMDLLNACSFGYDEIVDLLLPFAKECSIRVFAGAFHKACCSGKADIVRKIHNACPDLISFINKENTQRFGFLTLELMKLVGEFGLQFNAEDLGMALRHKHYEAAEWIADHNPSIKNLDKTCISNFTHDAHNEIVFILAGLGLIKTYKLMHESYGAYVNNAVSLEKFNQKHYNEYLSKIIANIFHGYIYDRKLDNNKLIDLLLPELQEMINMIFSNILQDLEPYDGFDDREIEMQALRFLLPYVTLDKAIFETAMIAFAEEGDFETLKTLILTYNLDVNHPTFIESAAVLYPWTNHNIIYKAVKYNEDLKVAKLLIEHGAFFPRDVFREAVSQIYGVEIDPITEVILTPITDQKFRIVKAAEKHCDRLTLLQDHHNDIRISLKIQLVALGVTQVLGHIVADYAYGGIQWPKAIEAASKEEQDVNEAQTSTWDDFGT